VIDASFETCSFCNKHKDLVQKLIVSDSVAICNECVDLCVDLLSEKSESDPKKIKSHFDPREIKNYIDQWVIGQHHAKMVLAVAVINHYKRLGRGNKDPEVAKANILMLGPTGSGKTLLARSIARYLDLPFVVADATSLTEAGYVGDDVESLVSRLFASSNYDVERTQTGIIFIDEIDKISRRSESASITRDVSGEGVQQALLKLVEGTKCRIQPQQNRKHPAADMIEIDTTNILFIAAGAFVGLENIIGRRMRGTSIGFASSIKQEKIIDLKHTTPDDLVRFGMIPEFVGRFPVTVALEPLTRGDLMDILTKTRDNLQQQYQWLLAQDGIDLVFDALALEDIVDRAMASGTGARALHAEMERVLLPHMYNAQHYSNLDIKRIVINKELVNNPIMFQGET
jgi:ATP-dependent Clp protease ATP-binding subunit ClpX